MIAQIINKGILLFLEQSYIAMDNIIAIAVISIVGALTVKVIYKIYQA